MDGQAEQVYHNEQVVLQLRFSVLDVFGQKLLVKIIFLNQRTLSLEKSDGSN